MPKSSEKSCEDRLSELPDSLVYEIFWLLPMRDVVRTTILSKRWNDLWTTTPYLNFLRHDTVFVNRALILWKGSRILKFKFGRVSCFHKTVFSDIDVWVRLAKQNGVEELHLEDNDGRELYSVPHSVYSCSSLKVLYLSGCFLVENNGNVQWNQLRSLTIEESIVDEDLISQVVSDSPQLEVFNLTMLDSHDNLSIRSCSLKKLSIKREFDNDEPTSDAELRIWSPNLETLAIIGAPYGKCLFMDVSSLTHLTLESSFQIGEDDIAGETLRMLFPSIQHVEKGLGDMKEKYKLSPSLNVKFLTLICYVTQYKEIVDLLHIFPKLETLVFRSDFHPLEFENRTMSFPQVESKLPDSFLLQLRTAEIILIEADELIFPFIEILLKHASKLKKMAIRGGRGIRPPSTPWFLEQKVLRMPRSSPTAKFIFADVFS